MAWAFWLAGPVLVTVLAALWAWWRSRPAKALTTDESMQAHGEYLDALSQTARSREHVPPAA